MQIFSLAVEKSTWFVKIFMIFLAKAFLDGVCKEANAVKNCHKKLKKTSRFYSNCHLLLTRKRWWTSLWVVFLGCRANDLDLEPYARTRLLVLSQEKWSREKKKQRRNFYWLFFARWRFYFLESSSFDTCNGDFWKARRIVLSKTFRLWDVEKLPRSYSCERPQSLISGH